jgi:hypothetical protein
MDIDTLRSAFVATKAALAAKDAAEPVAALPKGALRQCVSLSLA